MRGHTWAVALLLGAALGARAGQLANPSFEEQFGTLPDRNVWGEFGETFGECIPVEAGQENAPPQAHSGSRMVLINVAPNSWNGIWQQVPWDPETPFAWKAHYLIQGGDLGPDTATFMKVEFFDENDQLLRAIEGTPHREDTRGEWVMDTMRGTTPPGTASIRFVLIAGSNSSGSQTVANRIYWDDADTIE